MKNFFESGPEQKGPVDFDSMFLDLIKQVPDAQAVSNTDRSGANFSIIKNGLSQVVMISVLEEGVDPQKKVEDRDSGGEYEVVGDYVMIWESKFSKEQEALWTVLKDLLEEYQGLK